LEDKNKEKQINRIFLAKTAFALIFAVNGLHAFSGLQTMSKTYKVKDYIVERFLSPLLKNKNIIKIKTNHTHKAPYLHIHTVFVKENFHNLGLFRWNQKFNSYLNIFSKRPLILKPKKIYLISKTNFTKQHNRLLNIKKYLTAKELKHYLLLSKLHKHISYKKFLFYKKIIRKLINKKLIYLKNNEFIFLIDRYTQKALILSYNKKHNFVSYIASSKVSTGNPHLNSRNDRYFQTPLMIINRKKYVRGDWRANKRNFQEYGKRNNRIFYLGKHIIPLNDNSNILKEVHLALHSTNPIDSRLLGHKASRGCIRISSTLNKILDKGSILDGKNGKYIIAIDSSLKIKENIKRIKRFK